MWDAGEEKVKTNPVTVARVGRRAEKSKNKPWNCGESGAENRKKKE